MASSKNKLTEEQLREGIFNKIMNMILKRKSKKVLNTLKKNPALKQATDDVVKSIDNLQQTLRKKHGYDDIEFR